MHKGNPIVNTTYLLKKFPGKGGWTYAEIPEILPNKKNPFGWTRVRGQIDDYELKHCKLMPMGNGSLFLPVKAEIRKKIKKQVGDEVKIMLYLDESPVEIPNEIIECFKNEPKKVLDNFLSFSEDNQKAYLDWIYEAKTDETKANRIAEMINKVQKKRKLHE